MNKYKKLILSLTATLLSFTGVWAMGQKPIPQFKTFHEFGQFVNRYSPNDFLQNKEVFGAGRDGLLEVLLNGYNSLPSGTKALAENLFQSKFRLSSSQLSAKLASLERGKIIPVTVAQAQQVIRSINKEKADLQKQTSELNAKIATLEANIGDFTGKPADLENIQKTYDGILAYVEILRETIDNVNEDKQDLKDQLDILVAAGPQAKAEMEKVKKDLAYAEALLVQYRKSEAALENRITTLDTRIQDLLGKLSPAERAKEEARLLFLDYDDFDAELNVFYEKQIQPLTVPDNATINNMSDAESLNAINKLEQKLNFLIAARTDYANRSDDLTKKWLTIEAAGASDTADVNMARAKEKSVLDFFDELDNKILELENGIIAIQNRMKELENTENQKQTAAIIAELEGIEKEYQDFAKINTGEKIFASKTTTIKEFWKQPDLVQQLNDVNDIPELEAAINKLDAFKSAFTQKDGELQAKFAPIIAKIGSLKSLDPAQKVMLDELALRIKNSSDNYGMTPARLDKLKSIIQVQIDNLTPKKKTPEELLIDEIDKFETQQLPSENVANDWKKQAEEAAKDAPHEELSHLRQNLVLINNILKNYVETSLNEYNRLVAAAQPFVNAKAALAKFDARIASVKGLEVVAKDAKDAIEAEIKRIEDKTPSDEVTDVAVDMKDYSLSFKIGNTDFKAQNGQPELNQKFAKKTVKVSAESLAKAGKEISSKVSQSELVGIWGSIMNKVYSAADATQKDKIREFMRPVFATYKHSAKGNKKAGPYKKGLKLYDLKNSEIK